METRAFAIEGVHTVKREIMGVHVEIEGRSVPLYEGHEPGLGITSAQSRAARLRRRQCPGHHTASTRVSSSGRAANSRRKGHGKDSTH